MKNTVTVGNIVFAFLVAAAALFCTVVVFPRLESQLGAGVSTVLTVSVVAGAAIVVWGLVGPIGWVIHRKEMDAIRHR